MEAQILSRLQNNILEQVLEQLNSSIKGRVSVGRIDLSPTGKITLYSIRVVGENNEEIIKATKLSAEIEISSLINKQFVLKSGILSGVQTRIQVKNGHVDIAEAFMPRNPQKTSSENDWKLELSEIQLQSVDVNLDVNNEVTVKAFVNEVRASLSFDTATQLLGIRLQKLQGKESVVGMNQERLSIQQWTIEDALITTSSLRFEQSRFLLQDASVDGSGMIFWQGKGKYKITGSMHTAENAHFLSILEKIPALPAIQHQFTLSGELTSPVVDINTQWNKEWALAGYTLESGRIAATISTQRMNIHQSSVIMFEKQPVNLEGVILWQKQQASFDVTSHKLDLTSVLKPLRLSFSHRGIFSGKIEAIVQWSKEPQVQLTVNGSLRDMDILVLNELPALTVLAQATITKFDNPLIHLTKVMAEGSTHQDKKLSLNAEGVIDLDKKIIDLNANIKGQRVSSMVEPIRSLISDKALHWKSHIEGPLNDIRLSGPLVLEEGAFLDIPLKHMQSILIISNREIRLESLQGLLMGGRIQNGQLVLYDDNKTTSSSKKKPLWKLAGNLEVSQAEMKEFPFLPFKTFQTQGIANTSMVFSGALDSFQVEGGFHWKEASLFGEKLGSIQGTFHITPESVLMTDTSAQKHMSRLFLDVMEFKIPQKQLIMNGRVEEWDIHSLQFIQEYPLKGIVSGTWSCEMIDNITRLETLLQNKDVLYNDVKLGEGMLQISYELDNSKASVSHSSLQMAGQWKYHAQQLSLQSHFLFPEKTFYARLTAQDTSLLMMFPNQSFSAWAEIEDATSFVMEARGEIQKPEIALLAYGDLHHKKISHLKGGRDASDEIMMDFETLDSTKENVINEALQKILHHEMSSHHHIIQMKPVSMMDGPNKKTMQIEISKTNDANKSLFAKKQPWLISMVLQEGELQGQICLLNDMIPKERLDASKQQLWKWNALLCKAQKSTVLMDGWIDFVNRSSGLKIQGTIDENEVQWWLPETHRYKTQSIIKAQLDMEIEYEKEGFNYQGFINLDDIQLKYETYPRLLLAKPVTLEIKDGSISTVTALQIIDQEKSMSLKVEGSAGQDNFGQLSGVLDTILLQPFLGHSISMNGNLNITAQWLEDDDEVSWNMNLIPEKSIQVQSTTSDMQVIWSEGLFEIRKDSSNSKLILNMNRLKGIFMGGQFFLEGESEIEMTQNGYGLSSAALEILATGAMFPTSTGFVLSNFQLDFKHDEEESLLSGRIEILDGRIEEMFTMENFVVQRSSTPNPVQWDILLEKWGLQKLMLSMDLFVRNTNVFAEVGSFRFQADVWGEVHTNGRWNQLDVQGALQAKTGYVEFPAARLNIQTMTLALPLSSAGQLNPKLYLSARSEPLEYDGQNTALVDFEMTGSLQEGFQPQFSSTQGAWSREEMFAWMIFNRVPQNALYEGNTDWVIRSFSQTLTASLTKDLSSQINRNLGLNIELSPVGWKWRLGPRLRLDGSTLVWLESSPLSTENALRLQFLIIDHGRFLQGLSLDGRASAEGTAWQMSVRLWEQ